MNADVAVAEPRVEPITHPRDQSIGVHLRSSAAKICCLRRCLRVCGASRGFADMSGIMEAMYWSSPGSGTASVSRFKGSIRDGLNGMVGTGFAVGSRFKGSARDSLNGAVEPGFAVGSRFKGSVQDGLNLVVGPGVGADCGGRLAEGAGGRWAS